MWPVDEQLAKIAFQIVFPSGVEVINLLKKLEYNEVNIQALNREVHRRCQKKGLGEALHFIAAFCSKLYEGLLRREGNYTYEKAMLDLSTHFRYSNSFRDYEIYLFFLDTAIYIPISDKKLETELSDIQEDYIRLLSKKLMEMKFMLNQEDVFSKNLIFKKEPKESNKYVLFESTDDYATRYLLSEKNGRALDSFNLLKYYALCRSKSTLKCVVEKDALDILSSLIAKAPEEKSIK